MTLLQLASDYATFFGLQVLKLILIFNSSTINRKVAIITVDAQSFQINKLILGEFHTENSRHAAPPLSKQCVNSIVFWKRSRSCLHSSTCRAQQRYEFQKCRFIDKLCVKERNHVIKKKPIFFVGDRGYGINLRIKGHFRCGGIWKSKIHAEYCRVLITNEHNTSQTCVFCFSKTSHSLKLVTKKSKQHLCSVTDTSVYANSGCVLYSCGKTHTGRNSLSFRLASDEIVSPPNTNSVVLLVVEFCFATCVIIHL
ncbi:unnamed protein product [Mucor fragilis]